MQKKNILDIANNIIKNGEDSELELGLKWVSRIYLELYKNCLNENYDEAKAMVLAQSQLMALLRTGKE